MAACVGLMEPSASASASATTARLPWKWILEKLVDLPDFGVGFINEVITAHVPDIEEPHCRPLLERIALRNLEEMVVTDQICPDAIPCLKALIGQDLVPVTIGSVVKQRFNKELVLRVQTEVVLSVLRKDVIEEEKDWARYESELESVFGEAEEDNRLLDRKRELSALLKPKNQTKAIVAAYLEKYSLKKLRDDLCSFIGEKRESFQTTFLDQLSRDFRDAHGTPFSEELGDKEKSMEFNANAKQDEGTVNVESPQALAGTHINEDTDLQEVGQNPTLDEIGDMNGAGDQHIILRSSTVSGKKRRRRKLLPTQDDIGEDEPEVQVGNHGMKKSRLSPTSVVNPSMAFSRQGAFEIAISRFGPQSGCSPVKHGVESLNQLSSLKRIEEAVSAPRNLGSKVMEGAKTPPREPSRTNKYVVISDVESDAETQGVKSLSTDDVDDLIENCEDDVHQKKIDHFLSENGPNRRHTGKVGATEIARKETTIVLRERKVTVDRRKEASTASAEAKISQHGDHEKLVTKNMFMPNDTQDMYEVDLLELGSDGHEDVCHTCGLHGKLLCCDGCPISVHLKCIEPLVPRMPQNEEDWYCPVCLSLKTAREAAEAEKARMLAAREAAEAEKAAAAAKEKLKAFQESTKRRSSSEDNSLHHPKQENAVKQSRLRVKSVRSEEPDRASKLQQQSEQEPKLKKPEGRQDSDLPKVSLLSPIVKIALDLLKKRDEQDPENMGEDSLSEDQSKRVSSFRQDEAGKNSNDLGRVRVNERLVNASPKSLTKNGAGSIRDGSAKLVSDVDDVRKPHEISPSHVQGVSRRNPLAASTSGRGEVGGDRHGEELGEDCFEKSKYSNRHLGYSKLRGSDKLGTYVCSDRRHKPGHRRKNLPWTWEEEHALKEGVKRFSHNGSWGFQWKRILEFGAGRFHHTRTDVDLKDKWRNMVKGVS